MKIYNLGPDVAYDEPCGEYGGTKETYGYQWLVYWYEDGGYDGCGEGVVLTEDGKLMMFDLGHCSCYGPFDCWGNNYMEVTVDSIYSNSNNYGDYRTQQTKMLQEKVRELMSS